LSSGISPCPIGTANCHARNGLSGRGGFALPGSLGLGDLGSSKAIQQWIAASANAPKPPSIQDRAKALVREFSARAGGGSFVHIVRGDVANGLLARVDHPELISQRASSLCGPSAVVFSLASRDPVAYVRFVIALYEKGVARLNRLEVSAGKDLREYDPKGRIDPADWIAVASLRDSDNWFFDYQSVDNAFAGITLPSHLQAWFTKIGYSEVINDTNLVLTKDEKNIREAARLRSDNFWVCLFINDQALDPDLQDSRSLIPVHWVVLTSDVTIAADNISFSVFTWGQGSYAVPQPPPAGVARPLQVSHFLRNYYGYVAARY
jgi:hypothetical protein